ncbi:hypothetical protein BGW80DRAFT_1442416 [Lactifluus volemus]|nr:hypothetical protein BGW80DRAFT_1442416 [Lactifluus volemus]
MTTTIGSWITSTAVPACTSVGARVLPRANVTAPTKNGTLMPPVIRIKPYHSAADLCQWGGILAMHGARIAESEIRRRGGTTYLVDSDNTTTPSPILTITPNATVRGKTHRRGDVGYDSLSPTAEALHFSALFFRIP